jgi:hypothetical protein
MKNDIVQVVIPAPAELNNNSWGSKEEKMSLIINNGRAVMAHIGKKKF